MAQFNMASALNIFKVEQDYKRLLNRRLRKTFNDLLNKGTGGGNINARGLSESKETIKRNYTKRHYGKGRAKNLSLVSINVSGFLNVPFNKGEETAAFKKAQFIFDELKKCSFVYTYDGQSFPAYLGLWFENGLIYVDLSLLVEDEEDARKIGLKEKQQSYFNFNKGVLPLET